MSISVIIPAWRAEQTLRPAVESVLSTGVEDLQTLICVDSAADRTDEISEVIRKEHPDKIEVLRHPDGKNHGPGATRNLGLKHAQTEYVAFLDVDDAYLNNRFACCLDFLKQHQDVDFVYETTQVTGADKTSIWGQIGIIEGPDCERAELLTALGGGRCWHFNALTVRRNAVMQAGLLNEALRLGQDIEWFIRLAAFCRGKKLADKNPVAIYRRHSENRSSFDRGLNMPPVIGSAYRCLRKRGLRTEADWVLNGYKRWLLGRCTESGKTNDLPGLREKIWKRSFRFIPTLGLDMDFWKIRYWMLHH